MKKNKQKSCGKANKKNRKSIATNIRNVCVAINNNLAGGMILATLLFFLAGVANAVFGGFFNSCGIAIKNSSRSLLQMIVDIYYISAAKFEPTDIGLFPWLLSVELFLGFIWYSQLTANQLVAKMEQNLEEIKKLETGVNPTEVSDCSRKASNEDSSSKDQIKKLKFTIQKRLPTIKSLRCANLVIVVLTSATILYSISSMMFSFRMVKRFHRSVAEIRPFLSECEFHHLNRKWVTMKSQEDYKAIRILISEYEKRAEHDSEDRGRGM